MTAPWQSEALCRTVPTDVFFPEPKDRSADDKAKTICRQCPVMDQCRAYALDETEGIYGATNPGDRKR